MGVPVIVDILRTPFSRARPGKPETDVYNKQRMDDALSLLIPEIIKRNGVNPEDIGYLLTGCTMQMRENFMLGGRTIGILSDLPVTVPCQAIDRVCVGGLSAIHEGTMQIMLDYSDVVIASGMEHMNHAGLDPKYNLDLLSFNPRFFTEERYKKYDMGTAISMGMTAEKLLTMTDITREEMDLYAYNSHQRAAKALAEGYFKDEIMPLEVTLEDDSKQIIESDVCIRPETTLEKLAELQPAFKPAEEGGQITPGNSSPTNAGAATVLLMSEEKAKSYGLKPKAKILSMGWSGVDPSIMGASPVPAIKMALEKAGMEIGDIDFWEINEAFAIVPIYARNELGIDLEKTNVKGGAIAIGHPLAASGPRLAGTLARILNLEGGRYGLATLCGAAGQGSAIVLEKYE